MFVTLFVVAAKSPSTAIDRVDSPLAIILLCPETRMTEKALDVPPPPVAVADIKPLASILIPEPSVRAAIDLAFVKYRLVTSETLAVVSIPVAETADASCVLDIAPVWPATDVILASVYVVEMLEPFQIPEVTLPSLDALVITTLAAATLVPTVTKVSTVALPYILVPLSNFAIS